MATKKKKCNHSPEKIYSMFVSRSIAKEWWEDYFVGLGCTNCEEQMVLPCSKRICLKDRGSYEGRPHFAVEKIDSPEKKCDCDKSPKETPGFIEGQTDEAATGLKKNNGD